MDRAWWVAPRTWMDRHRESCRSPDRYGQSPHAAPNQQSTPIQSDTHPGDHDAQTAAVHPSPNRF